MNKRITNVGEKVGARPLPGWPHYADDEIEAVAEVLRSGKVNQWSGNTVQKFEQACALAFGQPHAIALANGTLALELALMAAGIGPGDEVIVTPRSFIASVSCVISAGATPVFADVDLASQNITAKTIEKVISSRTKAIIPVHLFGWPCNMPEIMELAKSHDLYVIEDCAQAHGAKINGQSVGSFGHAATFSFCQDKIISTGGEGGLVLFQVREDWQSAWPYKDHGKDYDAVFHKQHPPGFRWLHNSFGTNWRLTAMQAAIGLKQLEKLPSWCQRRRHVAQRLAKCATSFRGISVSQPDNELEHVWYRFSFEVDGSFLNAGWDRNRIMVTLNAEGIPCLEICPEIYREKAFDQLDYPQPECPNALALGKRILMLQVHPMLEDADVDHICDVLSRILTDATV